MPNVARYLISLLIGGFAIAAELPTITAAQLLTQPNIRVVDVRSAEEYQAGHLPGAINMPHDQLAQRIAELGDKQIETVLYCRSGRRVAIAADILLAAGFKKLHHLEGDFPAWQAAQNPVAH